MANVDNYIGGSIKGMYLGGNVKALYQGDVQLWSGSPIIGTVHIGSSDYPYVRIGRKLWTAANLNEPIGSKNSDYFTYDGYDGIYYKWYTVCSSNERPSTKLAAILPEGWRVPSLLDVNDLLSNSMPYDKVRADDSKWPSGTVCTNTLGFSATPSGYGSFSDQQLNSTSQFIMWTSTAAYDDNQTSLFAPYAMTLHNSSAWTSKMFYGDPKVVRLCKDI